MSIKRVLRSKEISPQTVASIGIAMHSGLHVGMLYRVNKQDSVMVLHLAWNRAMRCEPPSHGCTHWVRPNVLPDRARVIAAFCRRVWKQNEKDQPTYNFGSFKNYFHFDGRRVGTAKNGLTCASFVLAVFEGAKFPLIFDSQWPPPSLEDVEKQKQLLGLLKETPGTSEEDIAAFEAEIGNVRFRPLETAGAATSDQFPAGYEFSRNMEDKIEAFIAPPPDAPSEGM